MLLFRTSGASFSDSARTRAGKLLLAVVQRFCELTCWRVLLDGKDVRNHNLRALRLVVAVVSQEPFLFMASIHENIAIFRFTVSSVTSVTSF
jgi:ABC-type multidrug transport system fused ATPase/permease subunit